MWSPATDAVDTSTTIEGLCFLRGLCRGVILTIAATVQLRGIRWTVTT
jgi:hypothetical protein